MDKDRVLWEMSVGDGAAVVAAGEGLFEKELLRVGRWAHPAGKFVLEVTRDRLLRWVENFKRMAAKGIPVPVPYGHSYDARDNAGFVRDMRIEGDRLVGVLAVPREEDSARLGATATAVSVSVNPDFTDGQGERLGEVIEHVAITNYPIVSGQANFVPLSAGGSAEVIRLERERPAEADGIATSDEPPAPREEASAAPEVIQTADGSTPAEALAAGASAAHSLTPAPASAGKPFPGGDGNSLADSDAAGAVRAAAGGTPAEALAGNPPFGARKRPPVAHTEEEGAPADSDESAGTDTPACGGPQLAQGGAASGPVAQLAGPAGDERAVLLDRIARLEGVRVDGEVEALLLSGKISPAVEGHVRRVLSSEGQSIRLSATGESVSPAEELRAIFAAMPAGAWVPLSARSAAARAVSRRDFEVSDERARQLAMENARLLEKGGDERDSKRR